MNDLSIKSQKTTTLFNLETGEITQKFKDQLAIVGIVSQRYFPEYDPYHILNVSEVLKEKECFQDDCDFYKNGNTSKFKISYLQATSFLNDDYSDREVIMPRENKLSNAIFPCGVEATMHKRFNSLRESLEQGFKYDTIHFIVKDDVEKKEVEQLISNQYAENLNGLKINFVVANAKLDVFEKGLGILSSSPFLGEEYVIITDSTFAPKVEMIATTVLKNKKCLGIACAPIKDWKVEMDLYGYRTGPALENDEKVVIAWALSAWNFKTRQVDAEKRNYKKLKAQ